MRRFVALIALLLACGDDGGSPADGTTSGSDSSSTSGAPTSSSAATTDTTATTTDPNTSTSTSSTGSESSESSGGSSPYDIRDDDPALYTRVDRQGYPAYNTLVNFFKPGAQNDWNQGDPTDDVAMAWWNEFDETLNVLHCGSPSMSASCQAGVNGLDDDLQPQFTPCIPPFLASDTCFAQVLPFYEPSVLTIDLDDPLPFGSGRQLEERVMDQVLARILLEAPSTDASEFFDLSEFGLGGVSLNPPSNDVEFLASFPYLAPPHP